MTAYARLFELDQFAGVHRDDTDLDTAQYDETTTNEETKEEEHDE